MKWKIWNKNSKKNSTIIVPGSQTQITRKINKREKCRHPNEKKSLKSVLKTWNECNKNGHHAKISDVERCLATNDGTSPVCTICGVAIRIKVDGTSVLMYPEIPEKYFMKDGTFD